MLRQKQRKITYNFTSEEPLRRKISYIITSETEKYHSYCYVRHREERETHVIQRKITYNINVFYTRSVPVLLSFATFYHVIRTYFVQSKQTLAVDMRKLPGTNDISVKSTIY